MAEVLAEATRLGRHVVLRGAGRSYGDASIAPEQIVLDVSRLRRILNWDPTSGQIEAEAGLSIEELIASTLEDGWWPPVVSGTAKPTLAGALAMNIHGKNNFRLGTLGDHVAYLDVMTSNGEVRRIRAEEEAFAAIVGSAGSLAVILRVGLRMKRVTCGDLNVLAISCADWDDQFAVFEEHEASADYMVSWIDGFTAGRGLAHVAWHIDEDAPNTLRPSHQEIPPTIAGVLSKSRMPGILRRFNNRSGMRLINFAKSTAARILDRGGLHRQSLRAFSFLLDAIPGWERAYAPYGFIQVQIFVPREAARSVLPEVIEMTQQAKMESFLVVMKRHRTDRFLVSPNLDGYSLAMDFRMNPRRHAEFCELHHKIACLVCGAHGRFYLAKDSLLTPELARAYLGQQTLVELQRWKREFDSGGIFTSALLERLGLTHQADREGLRSVHPSEPIIR